MESENLLQVVSTDTVAQQKENINTIVEPDLTDKKKESAPTDYKLLISLLLIVFISESLYFNVATLLPEFMQKYYPEFQSLAVGGLLSAFPVSFIFTAGFMGEYLVKIGRKNAILYGLLTMSISSACFGLAGYITQNSDWYYACSFLARLIQGIGDALVNVAVPAIVALEWPDRTELYTGYVNAAMGAGMAFGPVIASGVMRICNYSQVFYFFAAYLLVLGLPTIYIIPKRCNFNQQIEEKTKTQVEDAEEEAHEAANVITNKLDSEGKDALASEYEQKPVEEILEEAEENKYEIPYSAFFGNKRIVMTYVAESLAIFCLCYADPSITVRLEDLGMSYNNIGFAFALMAGAFTLTSPFVGWICSKFTRPIIIQIGLFMMVPSLALMGPSKFFGLPDKPWPTLVGMGLVGFFIAFCFIPVLSDVVHEMKKHYTHEKHKQQIADKAAALEAMGFSLSSIIGPLVGGALCDSIGFQQESTIFAGLALLVALLYLFAVGIPNKFK